MPALSDYVTGTITLTNGSAAFTGAASAWLLAGFKEGDTILDVAGGGGRTAVIAAIASNTAGTLTRPWEGPTLTNVAYRMRYLSDGSRVSAQARNTAELLANGNLQAEAAIDGSGGNWLSYFTGAGTKARAALSAFARSLLDDADATTFRGSIGAQQAFANLQSIGGAAPVAGTRLGVNEAGNWEQFPVATQAIAEAGSDTIRGMTPQRTAQAIAAQRPRIAFWACPNSIQVIPVGADTKVILPQENLDLGGYFNTATSRWTPPAGTYRLTGTIWWREVNSGSAVYAHIYKNGIKIAETTLKPPNDGEYSLIVQTTQQASGSDYFELACHLAGGFSRPIDVGIRTNFAGEHI